MAGHDPQDAASADVPVPDYLAGLEKGVGGLRDRRAARVLCNGAAVGTAGAGGDRSRHSDAARGRRDGRGRRAARLRAVRRRRARDHDGGGVRHPPGRHAERGWLDYGEITANRFVLGAAITAADYINALRARRELTDAVNAALGRYDALLTASALTTAPRFDAVPDSLASASPMQTIPFNVTGHPAMSVPVGLGPERSAAVGADRRAAVRRGDGVPHRPRDRAADRVGAGEPAGSVGDCYKARSGWRLLSRSTVVGVAGARS